MRCAACPAAEGVACPGGSYCALVASGDPVKVAHVRRLTSGVPLPSPAAAPPLLHKGAALAQSLVRWVAAGRPRRSKAEVAAILEICRACPGGYYDPVGPACLKCGCGSVRLAAGLGINLKLKARMATESCPIGAWGGIDTPAPPGIM